MEKKYIPFLSFLLLFLVATPFESGLTIENPGWNTVIPSTSYLEIIVWSILLVILITYWIILRKGKVISSKIFAVHFILCLPFVFYARFNMFISMTTAENSKDILEFITLLDIAAYASLFLFLLSQIIFIIYIIKNKR